MFLIKNKIEALERAIIAGTDFETISIEDLIESGCCEEVLTVLHIMIQNIVTGKDTIYVV